MIQALAAQSGTTLFHVAAKYLGDASQWSRIALINGLVDPYLTASTTLILPAILTSQGQPSADQP